ncbi:hypothetical protein Esti_004747 [Eimeria stiedai]
MGMKMSEASRGSITFVIPPRNAATFQQKALSAVSLTQECGFYSMATDTMEAEPHSLNSLSEYEENWLPTSPTLPLSSDKGEYNSECKTCVPCTPRLFCRRCQCSSRGTADSKEPPLQLTSLVNALLTPASALSDKLQINDLLATVEKHALAAGSLAHQYSCAVSNACVEFQNTLAACMAQYTRLKQARQAYLSALLHLSNSLQPCGAAATHPCHCTRTCFLARVVYDLLALERLRKKAEPLTARKINQECTDLKAVQDTCRARLSAREPLSCKQLEALLEIESSALRLSHAAFLFDLRSLITMLKQSSPHEARAAEMIIQRVTSSKELSEIPCALCTEISECSRSLNGVVSLLVTSEFIQTCRYSLIGIISVTVLRVFELERILAPRLAAETRRLLRLIRLAANLEAASAHLCSFAAVLVGPPPDHQETQSQRGRPSVEKVGLLRAQQSANPTISVRETRGASQRLVLRGVAFHQGALLRATGLSQGEDFFLWQNCKTHKLLGPLHSQQMLTEVNFSTDRHSNFGCLQSGCKLEWGDPFAVFAQRVVVKLLQKLETPDYPYQINRSIIPDHQLPQYPKSFVCSSIGPLVNDSMTCLHGEGINGSSDFEGAKSRAASLQLLMWPKTFEPHAQDTDSRALSSCLADESSLPFQQRQEKESSVSSALSDRHHESSAAVSICPPCWHSGAHRLPLSHCRIASTPARADCCPRGIFGESSLKRLPLVPQSEQRREATSRYILSVMPMRPPVFTAGVTTAACCLEQWLGRAAQQARKESVMLLARESGHMLKRRPLSSDLEGRMHQRLVQLARDSQGAKRFFYGTKEFQCRRHAAPFGKNTPFHESAPVESSAQKEKLPTVSRERNAKHAWQGRPRCMSWLKSSSATISALSSTVTSTCQKLVAHSPGDDSPQSKVDENSRWERV